MKVGPEKVKSGETDKAAEAAVRGLLLFFKQIQGKGKEKKGEVFRPYVVGKQKRGGAERQKPEKMRGGESRKARKEGYREKVGRQEQDFKEVKPREIPAGMDEKINRLGEPFEIYPFGAAFRPAEEIRARNRQILQDKLSGREMPEKVGVRQWSGQKGEGKEKGGKKIK